jgi:PLP dependent protein
VDLPAERLKRVQDRIVAAAQRSGRNPKEIDLVAVTKSVSFERVLPLLQAGIQHFGENRVQEAQLKYADRSFRQTHPQAKLHLIGHLQTNKAKKAVELFDTVQSLDRVELGDALDRFAKQSGRSLPCLVEVKVSPEPTKMGLPPEQLGEFLDRAKAWTALKIHGLMAIAPHSESAEEARPFFKRLRQLADKARLAVLSMGMSNDFEVAIEEGATIVRIGTALFGSRQLQ